MNKLLNRLQNNDWTLLVSLPRNDLELAQAALNGGAQGLKVHINVHHHASGTNFGTWDEERETLREIVQLAGDVAVGIVPGGAPFATAEEFAQMAQIGIDFFDAYPADAPAWTMSQTDLDIMLAAYEGGANEEIRALQEMGMTMCEASIVAGDQYGEMLTTLDLARYKELAGVLCAPIIVPSQKENPCPPTFRRFARRTSKACSSARL